MSHTVCNKATYNLKTNMMSLWVTASNVTPKVYSKVDFEMTLERAVWLVDMLIHGDLQFTLSASGLLSDIVELANRYVYVSNGDQIRELNHRHAQVYNYNLISVISSLKHNFEDTELIDKLTKEWVSLIYEFCKSGDTSEVTGSFFGVFRQTTIFDRVWLEGIKDGHVYSVHGFLKKEFLFIKSMHAPVLYIGNVSTDKWGYPSRVRYTQYIDKAKRYSIGQLLRLYSYDTGATRVPIVLREV